MVNCLFFFCNNNFLKIISRNSYRILLKKLERVPKRHVSEINLETNAFLFFKCHVNVHCWFNLMSKTTSSMSKSELDFTIVIAGLPQVGKTTLLNLLVQGEFGSFPTTIGFIIDTFEYEGVQVRAIDLGGHTSHQKTMWRELIPLADAIVFVVDASNVKSLKESRKAIEYCIKYKTGKPYLLTLANKQDLPTIPLDEIIQTLNLERYFTELSGLYIVPSSCKTGEGVANAFNWLANAFNCFPPVEPIHAHAIYVYHNNGILMSSTGNQLHGLDDPNSDEYSDDILFAGFYSALNTIASNLISKGETKNGSIRELLITSPKGDGLRLVQATKGDLVGVVVTEERDSVRSAKKIARSAIEIVQKNLESENGFVLAEKLIEELKPLLTPPSEVESSFTQDPVDNSIKTPDEHSIEFSLEDIQFFSQTRLRLQA